MYCKSAICMSEGNSLVSECTSFAFLTRRGAKEHGQPHPSLLSQGEGGVGPGEHGHDASLICRLMMQSHARRVNVLWGITQLIAHELLSERKE